MSYWRYRAYNANLKVVEGVIIAGGEEDAAMTEITLKLRQQGLQVICLSQIDRQEYQRDQRIQKLRDRVNPQSGVNSVPCEHRASTSIQGEQPSLVSRLLRRLL